MGTSFGVIGVVSAIVLVLYLIPTIVAYSRGHHNRLAIFILNLFLGWTFLFWILGLIWATTAVRKDL